MAEVALLEAVGVSRVFGGLTAVSDVSFAVAPGEAVGLIGANGAGKTTLFNCLTGFDRPTSGDVLLRGSSIRGLARHQVVRAGIARTFQIVRPFRDLSVLANVMVPLVVAGHRDAAVRAGEVLERVGLGARTHVVSGLLSEGDLKRLELARALATAPTLLLLDEPFAGLSTPEIDLLSETIRSLHAEGTSLVVVEHKIGSLLKLVDRVVVLDHGVKIADGKPRSVMKLKVVVEAYLGGGAGAKQAT